MSKMKELLKSNGLKTLVDLSVRKVGVQNDIEMDLELDIDEENDLLLIGYLEGYKQAIFIEESKRLLDHYSNKEYVIVSSIVEEAIFNLLEREGVI